MIIAGVTCFGISQWKTTLLCNVVFYWLSPGAEWFPGILKVCCVLLCLLNSWPWWRHQMETFSALLAICAGNSPAPVNFPHKGQWRGALMFALICVWINAWVNNRKAGDLRRYCAHYDVIVMTTFGHWWHRTGISKLQSRIDAYQSSPNDSIFQIFEETMFQYRKPFHIPR